MAQNFGDRITPYLTIWTEPRATIRRIVEIDPERSVIALAALAPVLALLEREWMRAVAGHVPGWWPFKVVFEVVFAGLLGIVFLYLNGLLVTWAAHALGGVGETRETRAALAWGKVPSITASAAAIVALLSGAMQPPEIGINGLPRMTPPTFELGGVYFVLGLWGFIVTAKCIGEVHRFSAWRALLAEIIVLVALLLILGGLVLLALAVSQGNHR